MTKDAAIIRGSQDAMADAMADAIPDKMEDAMIPADREVARQASIIDSTHMRLVKMATGAKEVEIMAGIIDLSPVGVKWVMAVRVNKLMGVRDKVVQKWTTE